MMDYRLGWIVCINSKKGGIFSWGQRHFTHLWVPGQSPRKLFRSFFTHSALIFQKFLGNPTVLEADLAVAVTPFLKEVVNNTTKDYKIFAVRGFTDAQLVRAMEQVFLRFAGEDYGIWQIPFFIYRWFLELFHRDVRKFPNWFPDHVICSELVWWFFYFLSDDMPALRSFINQWNSNNFHAGDTYTVCMSFPKTFVLVEERWTTPLPEFKQVA